MRILFFDTETTGLPVDYKAPLSDSKNYPHMVQFAYILTDETGRELKKSMVVFNVPEDVEISKESSDVHGILRDFSNMGFMYHQEMIQFTELVKEADLIVGHNISFDRKIVGAQIFREGLVDFLHGKPRICTMFKSTKYCQVPRKTGKGIKWPTLTELYEKLFDEQFHGAHDALADIQATAKCYFELRRLEVITDAMIEEEMTKWINKNNEAVISFIKKVDGCKRGEELTKELEEEAKNEGLIIIFGESDDLIELRGSIHDEVGAFTGTTFYITPDLQINEEFGNHEIKAKWDHKGYSWFIDTDLPHMSFNILNESDENYCRGIVFHKNSLL